MVCLHWRVSVTPRGLSRAAAGPGALQSVTGPSSAQGALVTLYACDGYGRMSTVTDPQSYTVLTEYDAGGRPKKVTYPDGTFEQTVCERLHAERHRDRLGPVDADGSRRDEESRAEWRMRCVDR